MPESGPVLQTREHDRAREIHDAGGCGADDGNTGRRGGERGVGAVIFLENPEGEGEA